MDRNPKTDPTVKILLALIAVALWAILLRPSLTPETAQAAPAAPSAGPSIASSSAYIYVAQGGRIYTYLEDPAGSQPHFKSVRGIDTRP